MFGRKMGRSIPANIRKASFMERGNTPGALKNGIQVSITKISVKGLELTNTVVA